MIKAKKQKQLLLLQEKFIDKPNIVFSITANHSEVLVGYFGFPYCVIQSNKILLLPKINSLPTNLLLLSSVKYCSYKM